MCLISFVIPHYNNSDTVIKNIKILLGFDFGFDFQIIVVDDFSINSHCNAIAEYIKINANGLVKMIALPRNKGANFCRRLGLRSVFSKYVVFLDSDDELTYSYLSRIAKIDHDDIAFVNVEYYKDKNLYYKCAPLGVSEKSTVIDNGSKLLFVDNFNGVGIQTSAWILETKSVKGYYWPIGVKGHQDWLFLMKYLTCKRKVKFIKDMTIERHLTTDGGHISKGLDSGFSIDFCKRNRKLYSYKAYLFFCISVVSLKKLKECKSLSDLFLGFLFFVNIFRFPFIRYVYHRLSMIKNGK
ncbi:glycosyltransferase family 2 protein [Amphritea opalescens]|uniref:Glycosyltransferase family 2 protein n=1 Tax=Amphritea opalescens TaxID=2490544 RepID=A0A430KTI3_9GAMM|nr:glycosyltransferase family 2 protein [Amphritea opalescens]RTE66809.1 glycosyltransferase family 2 protein [Amphritea opalescens]